MSRDKFRPVDRSFVEVHRKPGAHSTRNIGLQALLVAAVIAAGSTQTRAQGFIDEPFEDVHEAEAFDGLTVAGAQYPQTVRIDDAALKLFGAGTRTEARFVMYSMGVYVVDKELSAAAIVDSDTPAVIRLEVVSPLVTARRFSEAVRAGFHKATDGNTADLEDEIGQFLVAVKDGLEDDDVLELHYVPGVGTHFRRNGELQTTVSGLEFKQALFGIWLGDDPIDVSLKDQLLGTRH